MNTTTTFLISFASAASLLAAQPDVGWLRVAPQNGVVPPANAGGVLTYEVQTLSTVLLTGGQTWLWDGRNWADSGASAAPNAVFGAARTFDFATNRIVVFGGQAEDGTFLDETWQWDGTDWAQVVTPFSPPARVAAALSYDSVTNQVVLFGGQGVQGQLLDDTWTFDGVNWTPQFPASSPSRRAGHAMADAFGVGVVMFGGTETGTPALDETWIWDGADWSVATTNSAPAPRYSAQLAYDFTNSRVLLFGGVLVPNPLVPQAVVLTGDLWQFDGTDWSEIEVDGDITELLGKSVAWDFVRDTMVAFEGALPISDVTWELQFTDEEEGRAYSIGNACGFFAASSLEIAAGTGPRLGSLLEFRARGVAPDPGIVYLALSLNETPPTPLTALGLQESCIGRVSFDNGLSLLAPSGVASLSLPIPQDFALLGFSFVTQALVFEPPIFALFGPARVTNALRVTIGT